MKNTKIIIPNGTIYNIKYIIFKKNMLKHSLGPIKYWTEEYKNGDASIIARLLANGHVQYGWSGNGGYFSMGGIRLLLWYQEPKNVEYLFSLGQTSLIGKIGSEKGGFNWYETHCPTGEPFWLANTERMIFSRIVL